MRYLAALILVLFSEIVLSTIERKESFPVQSQPVEAFLKLTQEEESWLAQHKNIRIAYDASLPPYSFVNDQGKIDGVAVEIMAILSLRLGIDFTTYIDSNWKRLYHTAAKRKVDMVATMVDRPDRSDWFAFTKPYLTKSLVIVTKLDNTTINSRADLGNKKIAVVKGYQYAEEVSHEFPNVKRVKVESMLDSLIQVDKGQVDGAILFLGTANYLQAKHKLNRLKTAAFYDRNSANESIAVRKDWPILLGILQKGLDSLAEQEVQEIFAKWVVQGGEVAKDEKEAKKTQPVVQPVAKKVDETEKRPTYINIDKTDGKTISEFNRIGKMVGASITVFALLMAWVLFGKKDKKLKQKEKINNGIEELEADLQAEYKDPKELPIVAPSIPVSEVGQTSQTKPDERPIVFNIEQLRSSLQSQPEVSGDESVRYQRDIEGRLIFVSPSITNLLGYSAVDFMENFRQYLTDNLVNQNLDGLIEACMQGHPNEDYEIEIYDAGKNIHWLEFKDTAIYDGQGHCIGIDGVFRDITDQRLYAKVAVKSSTESDTAAEAILQHSLQGQLQLAIDTANQDKKSFTLIRLSLERLRFLDGNLLGYWDGDVLKEANKRLRATLRDTDTVTELEADKFALILPDTDNHTASLIVDKIRKILQVPYLVGVQSIVLDTNFGIAIYPDQGMDPESLINKTQYLLSNSPSDLPALKTRIDYDNQGDNLRLQQDLVLALDECKVSLRALNPHNINALQRHSQFSVYYQSQHNLKDYGITGFEALIRWQHPVLGLLLPRDFVDLVKDIGLLDVMTYWIIQQVGFQAMAWEQKSARPKLLAINLGDLASNQSIGVAKIANIIKETGAKPEWFAFSIPENEVAKNHDLVMLIINQLVAEGFTVAIDNFGLDSSILAQLTSNPAQIIEIDPAFIRYLPDNAADGEIVTYSIEMLHEMGKTVIAKEIETERQLEFLKACGCDVIQGHLLSRPLPAKEAKELIETLPDFAWYLKQ